MTDIHTAVAEILADFEEKNNIDSEMKSKLDMILQFAWNRGYKVGYFEGQKDTFRIVAMEDSH